jgi:hypothetical protein
MVCVDWIQLAQCKFSVEGLYEYGNKPTGLIKGGEFLNQMSNYQLPKKVNSKRF